jgi:hypothetical protein
MPNCVRLIDKPGLRDALTRRGFLRLGVAGSLGLGSAGCGTLLYPERIGQSSGPLDWKVVALDTLGLLLFFVPGVIAFAVDFVNGTIYLPEGQYGRAVPTPQDGKLIAIDVPQDELSHARVEQIVSKHAKQDVKLVAGEYRTRKLTRINEFWSTHNLLAKWKR